jgi:hypothetical protein
VVEHLPSIYEIQGSSPSTGRKKKERKKKQSVVINTCNLSTQKMEEGVSPEGV